MSRSVQLLTRDSTLLVELCGGKTPVQGSSEAAGLDLHASVHGVIPAHTRALVPTGLKIRTPHGTYGRITPRSGLAVKGIDVGAGVIDRDYTGEVKVLLINHSDNDFSYQLGDRVAQLILERVSSMDVEIVPALNATKRGDAGFGSTGR